MNTLKIAVMSAVFFSALFLSVSYSEEKNPVSKSGNVVSKEMEGIEKALETAKKGGLYLFLCFYEKMDDSIIAMEKEIESFRKESSAKSMIFKTAVSLTKDTELVEKFGLDKVKLPAVLVIAPNGAVTGGFPEKVTKQQLEGTIVSALDLNIMKTLQEGKISLVLIQNEKTKLNKESLASAEEFKNDSTMKDLVESVIADPSAKESKRFLSACKLDENLTEASIVVIVPPGAITGVFKGKIDKTVIINSLRGGTCGPGGSSGGCGTTAPGCGQ